MLLGKSVSVVRRQRMDLTFEIAQRPYDYVGDCVDEWPEENTRWGFDFVLIRVKSSCYAHRPFELFYAEYRCATDTLKHAMLLVY